MPIRAGSTPVTLKSGRRLGMKVGGQGAAAVAAFAPTDISGLVAWWDFSDITTLWQDTGRTSAITADGQTIKGVTDKSGAGAHLSNATGATYKAAIVTGKSVSRYNGTNQTLRATITADTSFSLFLVAKEASAPTTTTRDLVSWHSNAQFYTDTDVGTGYNYFSATASTAGGTPANWNAVLIRVDSAAAFNIFLNGGVAALTGNPSDEITTSTTLDICSAGSNSNWGDFDIGEGLLYNSSLNSTDSNLVGNYLTRWTTSWTAV